MNAQIRMHKKIPYVAACVALACILSPSLVSAGGPPVIHPDQNGWPTIPSSIAQGMEGKKAKPSYAPVRYDYSAESGAMVRSPLSTTFLNRIVTPFSQPIVKMSSSMRASVQTVGQTIFISLARSQTEPVVLYVMQKGEPLDAITLMLDPKDMGPVQINLQQAGAYGTAGPKFHTDDAAAQTFEKSNSWSSMLVTMIRQIALGQVPSGYLYREYQSGDEMPSCSQKGLSISPRQIMVGHELAAYVGVMTNETDLPIEFTESSCAHASVVAVSSWPGPLIQPHESVEVYEVVKQSRDTYDYSSRPSAIVGGSP